MGANLFSGAFLVERSRSQIGRQSVWHSPWHLNSLPRPPILPPHSGHTQFRMPEITSAVSVIVLHLINHIPPSMTPNDRRTVNYVRSTRSTRKLGHARQQSAESKCAFVSIIAAD